MAFGIPKPRAVNLCGAERKKRHRQWKQIHPKLSVYTLPTNLLIPFAIDAYVGWCFVFNFVFIFFGNFSLPPPMSQKYTVFMWEQRKSDNFNVFNHLWRDQAFVWKFCWLWPHTVWVAVPASSTHLRRAEQIVCEYPFRATPIGLSAHTHTHARRTLNELGKSIASTHTHAHTTPGCVYAAR